MDSFFMGPDEPEIHKEYRVREGTVWEIRFTRGDERKPVRGFVSAFARESPEAMEAETDDTGRSYFTLPSEGRDFALTVREASPPAPQLETGSLSLLLKWESNFRPAEMKEIVQEEQRRYNYRLIDANEKSATLIAGAPIKPVIENGKLVIEVPVQDRDSQDFFGAVTGLVLDDKDRPLPGRGRSLAMVMVAESLPGLKRWVGTLGLKDSAKLLVIRVVVAFLLHAGRMSCLRAAGAVRCEARHRAQISRFLARPRWRKLDINAMLRQHLLELEAGEWSLRVHRRRHAGQPERQENRKHLQHRQSSASAVQGASIRQKQACSQELPQLHDGPVDHAVGHPDSVLQALLHSRILQEVRPGAPHHSRGSSRLDSRTAITEKGEGERARRYGLRRRGGPRGVRRIAATRGYFRATQSASWLARKGTGRRCVRSSRIGRSGHGRPSGLLRAKVHTPYIGVCRPIGSGRKRRFGRSTSTRKDSRCTRLARSGLSFRQRKRISKLPRPTT